MRASRLYLYARILLAAAAVLVLLSSCAPTVNKQEFSKDRLAPAYRQLYFGYSQQQVDTVSHQDNDIHCDICFVQAHTKLNGLAFSITLRYFKGRLYQIMLSSEAEGASHFSGAGNGAIGTLADYVRKLHGKPSDILEVDLTKIPPGGIKYRYRWPLTDKNTLFEVGIGRYETTYYAVLTISYQPLIKARGAFVKERGGR
jgi:hypothetical protein